MQIYIVNLENQSFPGYRDRTSLECSRNQRREMLDEKMKKYLSVREFSFRATCILCYMPMMSLECLFIYLLPIVSIMFLLKNGMFV